MSCSRGRSVHALPPRESDPAQQEDTGGKHGNPVSDPDFIYLVLGEFVHYDWIYIYIYTARNNWHMHASAGALVAHARAACAITIEYVYIRNASGVAARASVAPT